ncbi:SiaB family protein kinase [Cohnella faecalis]|uniref:Uncharacterized protein n=1 Tax=Cohnella faecalis TaxID=2315694 RepID=A0A398CVC1_9BACL|nr:SiaB family protein kinase [Cohnella faecalis]RIE03211.1 hypothetical protein D3H35_19885 [Cohnella faecalis]
MEDNPLLEVQTVLRRNGILISFSGRLSQQLIEEYGEAVKTYLETDKRPKNEIYHIFSIFIEQTQNIKNYCTSKSESALYDQISSSCIVTIGRETDGNFICSGNLVDNGDLATLISHIEPIINLQKDELKRLYKEKLKQPFDGTSSGAGVGLIDIARKAALPLEYSVTKLDDRVSFFTLKAVV